MRVIYLKKICLYMLLLSLTTISYAGNWAICDLRVHIDEFDKKTQTLAAPIISVHKKESVECPEEKSQINFIPETLDYQSILKKKYWPKPGRTATIRYQYLDGICKSDGNDAPCRIKHFILRK